MKFTCIINIDSPIEKVAEYFADPQYLKEYQEGFKSKELIEGESGQKGAISKMIYQNGKNVMELTETILENKLPYEFVGQYHHKHMDNTMKCTFEDLGNGQTRYTSEIEYTAFRGFIPKLLGLVGKGMFRKQVEKWLNNFKSFVEAQS